MLERDEPEILEATRSWVYTQARFRAPVDVTRPRHEVVSSWYDTSVSPHVGALCVVNDDRLDELVGDFVRVSYGSRYAWLYCVGHAGVSTPFAITRTAWFRLGLNPSRDEARLVVQAT